MPDVEFNRIVLEDQYRASHATDAGSSASPQSAGEVWMSRG